MPRSLLSLILKESMSRNPPLPDPHSVLLRSARFDTEQPCLAEEQRALPIRAARFVQGTVWANDVNVVRTTH